MRLEHHLVGGYVRYISPYIIIIIIKKVSIVKESVLPTLPVLYFPFMIIYSWRISSYFSFIFLNCFVWRKYQSETRYFQCACRI